MLTAVSCVQSESSPERSEEEDEGEEEEGTGREAAEQATERSGKNVTLQMVKKWVKSLEKVRWLGHTHSLTPAI
jgi:hypothetical protein